MAIRGILTRGIIAAGTFVVAVAMAPDSSMAQSSKGSSSPEDLLYRLQVLDAEIADIRARLGGAGAGAARDGATTGDTAALEAELRRMTARLERIERAQRAMRDDLTRRLGDIEFRLNDLEGVPNDGKTRPVAGDLSANNNGSDAGSNASIAERNALNAAIEDVEKGRFDQADDRLRRFMREFPDSPLLGEARYWLGESLFVRGIHADAAKSYLDGYNGDREGPFAARNLLRLGETLGRLGQINEACLTLYEVRRKFPNDPSGAADKSDALADSLSCN